MFSPDISHDNDLRKKPLLAFDETKDFDIQKTQITEKLKELLGTMPEKCELNIQIEFEQKFDGFTEKRFTFNVEKEVKAACHLWTPDNGEKKHPVVIALQGHSTGMHISMGRPKNKDDEKSINSGDRDFARQIIKQGYAALVMDQRGMGERRTDKMDGDGPRCHVTAMTALLLGKTMIGERVWDISRAIDALETFDEIDSGRIACMGNSGGGTTTFYAACMDERIKLAMPSCSVCTYKDSIASMPHCVCNFIPKISNYVDMGDLSVMIAPRPLVIVAGKEDPIFPRNGVKESFDIIQKIYKKCRAPENCRLVWGDGEHRFYADDAWPVFNDLFC